MTKLTHNQKILKPGKSGNTVVERWHPLYGELTMWAANARAIQTRINEANDTIDRVVSLCNTGGQIRLVWPELTGLIPGTLQAKLEGTIARQIPPCIAYFDDGEEGMRAAICKATIEIATANVLPEPDSDAMWI